MYAIPTSQYPSMSNATWPTPITGRDRETATAMDAASFVTTAMTKEITAYEAVAATMRRNLAELPAGERTEIEQASAVLRKARLAGGRALLPLTVLTPRRRGPAVSRTSGQPQVLREARRRGSLTKRQRVLAAVHEMEQRREPVTFAAVARHARVSTWLVYAEGVREHIETAIKRQAARHRSPCRAGPQRGEPAHRPGTRPPGDQRAAGRPRQAPRWHPPPAQPATRRDQH